MGPYKHQRYSSGELFEKLTEIHDCTLEVERNLELVLLLTMGPRCEDEVARILKDRWLKEDKKRWWNRVAHLGEILLVVGLSFLALALTIASSNAPQEIIDPYFWIGAILFFSGLAITILLLVHAATRYIDRFAVWCWNKLNGNQT